MNKIIISLLGMFFLMAGLVFAASIPALPEAYHGSISNAGVGVTITASIGGASVGSLTLTESEVYGAGASEKLMVCGAGEAGCVSGGDITFSATSGSISTGSNFTPGGVTALDLAYTATTAASASSSSAGSAGGGSATSTETLTEVALDSYIINRLDKTLPEGWEDANLKYYQVGDASTETYTENNPEGIEKALDHVTNTKTIAVLQELKTGFESGEKVKATVARTLTVYKINNQDTGDAVYRSQITIVVTAPKDMKNMKVVEVIPKTVAKSTDDLVFTGETPEILQKDPVVQWVIDSLKKGKSLDLTYIVKKKLSSIKSYTLVGGEGEVAPPSEEEETGPTGEVVKEVTPPEAKKFGWLVAVLIVVVGLGVYFVYTKKKGKE